MTNDVSIVSGDTASGGDNLQSVNIDDIFDDVVDEPSKISRMLSTNETTVIVEFQKRETHFAPALKTISITVQLDPHFKLFILFDS